jgi:hypothetical protein
MEKVVDKESALLKLANETPAPVAGTDHRTICKFGSKDSQKYITIWNGIKDLVENSWEAPPSRM